MGHTATTISTLLGGRRALEASPKSTGDWNQLLSTGIPVAAADALESWLALADSSLAPLLGISEKIPDSVRIERFIERPNGWRDEPPGQESMRVGSRWLAKGRTAVLQVPSVLIPEDRNYLLNPEHPGFVRLHISRPKPFTFDPRMWR